MRILHAPTDVGNQPWGVSLGERWLGHRSRVMVYVQHNPDFGSDVNLHFERRTTAGKAAAVGSFFLRSLAEFDVFHFYFAASIIPKYVDLHILKLLRKKIVFTFQGCDIRPAPDCPAAVLDPEKHHHEEVGAQRRRLQFLQQFASKTYVLNPDLLDASPTSTFLPYAVDFTSWEPRYPRHHDGDEVVIFHAPSDRLVKGTDHVEEAVAKLRSRGFRVRLDLVYGKPRSEVIERLQRADLAIDQLLGGWYGAAAVEMMALGKPTLCFLRDDWLPRVPFASELPIINVSPDTLTARLQNLLDHPERWPEIGERGRAFVESIHHPRAVAERTLHDYATS